MGDTRWVDRAAARVRGRGDSVEERFRAAQGLGEALDGQAQGSARARTPPVLALVIAGLAGYGLAAVLHGER